MRSGTVRFPPIGFSTLATNEITGGIPHYFETVAREHPERPAIKFGAVIVSYSELNQLANRIARAVLQHRPPGPEAIALLLNAGINVIAGIIGIQKAGKYFVAMDPSFPRERNRYILQDCQAPMIVTESEHHKIAESLGESHRSILNIEALNDSISSEDLSLPLTPNDLAAVMYTSGSTGDPKGVLETHGHGIENALLNSEAMGTTAVDRLAFLHSISFSGAKVILHTSLFNGACLLPFDLKIHGIARFAQWLRDEAITVMHCPPAVLRELASLFTDQPADLPHLRLIRLSGTAILRRDFNAYQSAFPRHTYLELGMGTSESGQICSAVVNQDFAFPGENAPLGYPCARRKVRLLDDAGTDVRPGEVGEITVQGRYLSSGYWRQPDLTKSKFKSDPEHSEEQIYYTGDMGLRLPDGLLIHKGRKDFLIRIRGYAVDLLEVEKTLRTHADVTDAVAIGQTDEFGETRLIAYITTRSQAGAAVSDLRKLLGETLADYMIPSVFVKLGRIPLTPNGKVDRNALPDPGKSRPEIDTPYEAPTCEIERTVVAIWSEALALDRIGIHDNFFHLGGHSLAASRIITRLAQQFNLELSMGIFLNASTVAEMATVIAQHVKQRENDGELASILSEIETMTEEESRIQLAGKDESTLRKGNRL